MIYSVTIDYLVHTLLKQLTISEAWDWLNTPVLRYWPDWPDFEKHWPVDSSFLDMWILVPDPHFRANIIYAASRNPKELL